MFDNIRRKFFGSGESGDRPHDDAATTKKALSAESSAVIDQAIKDVNNILREKASRHKIYEKVVEFPDRAELYDLAMELRSIMDGGEVADPWTTKSLEDGSPNLTYYVRTILDSMAVALEADSIGDNRQASAFMTLAAASCLYAKLHMDQHAEGK